MSNQMPPAPYLVMLRGAQPFRFFPLNKSVITLGRAPTNDIVIMDRSVSRYHARLLYQNGQWVIEDLGSDNGVWINGVRITAPTMMADDMIFGLGPNVRFEMELWPDPPQNVRKRRLFPKWLAPAGLLGLGVGGLVIAGLVLLAILAVLTYFAFGWGGGEPWIQIEYAQAPESAPPEQPSTAAQLTAEYSSEGPEVVIFDLIPDLYIPLGDSFDVQASAYDEDGVVRMDLWVDDQLALTQASPAPEGMAPFFLNQTMLGTSEGTFSLVVRAYDSLGNLGESMAYNVTVSEDAEPELRDTPVQYIPAEGDTLQSISQQTGFSVPQLQEANPGLSQLGPDDALPAPPDAGGGSNPGIGNIVALPNLPPPAGGVPSLPPPDQIPLVGLNPIIPGDLGQLSVDVQPSDLPGQVLPSFFPDPSSLPNLAQMPKPSKLHVDYKDCKIILSWQFNSPEAENILIYRRAKPGEIKARHVATLPPTAVSFADAVAPGEYEYSVEAVSKPVNNVVERVRSDPYFVTITPLTDCVAFPDKYRILMFQPVSFNPHQNGIVRANMFYRIRGPNFRRLPAEGGEYFATGSLFSQVEAFPLPPELILNPDQPILFEVNGRGLTLDGYLDGEPGKNLYTSFASIDPKELNNGGKKTWLAQGGNFSLEFKMWSVETRWTGSGWSIQTATGNIPAPKNLQLSEYKPGVTRLTYEWSGDKDHIDGFILNRSYLCPGRGTVTRAPLYSWGRDRYIYFSPRNEPAGCGYRYTVTAYGRYGESSPSKPLTGSTQSIFQAARVTFQTLQINSLPDGSSSGDITLVVGPDKHTGAAWLQEKKYALDNLAMDGMIPNNRFGLILEKGADASIGFRINPDKGLGCDGFISIKEDDLQKLSATLNKTIHSSNRRCAVTVSITGLPDYAPPAPGSRIMPQADLSVYSVKRYGYQVYTVIDSLYRSDDLDDARFLLQSSWGEYCPGKPPLIYGTAEHWVQGGAGAPTGVYYLDSKVDQFVNKVYQQPDKNSACPMKLLVRVTPGQPVDNPTYIDTDETNNERVFEILTQIR